MSKKVHFEAKSKVRNIWNHLMNHAKSVASKGPQYIPSTGSNINLLVAGKEVLYMPSQAVRDQGSLTAWTRILIRGQVTLIEEEVYHSECSLIIRKTKRLLQFRRSQGSIPPRLIKRPQLRGSSSTQPQTALPQLLWGTSSRETAPLATAPTSWPRTEVCAEQNAFSYS